MEISPTTLADVLGAGQVMDAGIRPVWSPAPRISGPAFTVRCPPSDHLMLHAAVHRAPPGSVIVVESGDTAHALAGGHVCAVARRRGVAGFVLDGMIRDVAILRDMGFPVFARGVIAATALEVAVLPLNVPVRCGGVPVTAGDLVVADEDGVTVVPEERIDEVLSLVRARPEPSLDDWEREHRAHIDRILHEAGWQSDHP
jgi:4-hydroxy-4-methyl-2-oxoglutarate aldolase